MERANEILSEVSKEFPARYNPSGQIENQRLPVRKRPYW